MLGPLGYSPGSYICQVLVGIFSSERRYISGLGSFVSIESTVGCHREPVAFLMVLRQGSGLCVTDVPLSRTCYQCSSQCDRPLLRERRHGPGHAAPIAVSYSRGCFQIYSYHSICGDCLHAQGLCLTSLVPLCDAVSLSA